MNKFTKLTGGALAAAGMAAGLGAATASTASATEVPPQKCTVHVPIPNILESVGGGDDKKAKKGPKSEKWLISLGALCETQPEKLKEEPEEGDEDKGDKDKGDMPGNSENAPGQNKDDKPPFRS